MLADPSEAEREVLGAIPYQRNEAVLHTDTSLLPRRRAAWSSWNFHLSERAGRRGTTVTYWMNNLQRLRADREFCVTLNRGERDRPREGDPPDRLRPPGLHRRGRRRPGPPRRDQRRCAAPTTAAPTGAGASTRTAWSSALRACERDRLPPRAAAEPGGAGRMSASAVYEGWVRHRRFEPVEHALPLPALPHVPRPRRAAGGARPLPALVGAAAGARPASAAPTSWATRAAAGRVRPRRGRGRRPARRPAGPVRLLANLRYLGHSFNPVSFYYCFDPAGERVEAVVADVKNIPWGERHPYVSARGEREGTVLTDELDKTLPRLPADGDGPDLRLPRHRARRAARRPHRVAAPATAGAGKAFDATLSLRRRELSRPLLAGLLARYPAMSLQVGGEDLRAVAAAEAEGRALLPAPRGEPPEGVRLAMRDALARAARRRRPAAASARGRIEVVEGGARPRLRPGRRRAARHRRRSTTRPPGAGRCAAASASARPTSTGSGRPTTSSR